MPPRIDLNSLPAFSDIPGGPLKSLNKPELFSVARELGIGLPLDPRTITVETLRGQVTQGIGKLPNDVRFHKFIVHRAQTTGGAALRNSADKDKEDVGAKDVQPTGAHRKLLEQRVKSDPAGQLKHLKAPADADKHKGKARQSLGSLSSLSSEEETIPPELDETPEEAPPNPLPEPGPALIDSYYKALQRQDAVADLPIAVEFCGENGVVQLVYIPTQIKASIPLFRDVDAGTVVVSLRKLIPAALAQLSPSKETSYRRLTLMQGNVALSLGSVEQFLKGNFPDALEAPAGDMCPLEIETRRLVLSLLWKKGIDEAGSSMGNSSTAFQGDVKPLEEARDRKKSADDKKKKKKKFDDDSDEEQDGDKDPDLLECLRDAMNVKPDDKSIILNVIGPRLVRWNGHQEAINYCDDNLSRTGVSKKTKPYRVPEAYRTHKNETFHKYANRPFGKKHVALALGISNGTLTADRKLFTNPDIEFVAQAKMWVGGEGGAGGLDDKVRVKFEKMTVAQWTEYINNAKAAHEKAEADARKANRRAGKRARSKSSTEESTSGHDSSSEEDEEHRLKQRLAQIKADKERAAKKARKGEGKSKPSARLRSNSLDKS